MAKATFFQGDPLMIDYTPGSAVAAGAVVVSGNSARIAHLDIAANTLGALAIGFGVYKIEKKTAAIADGAEVYWDATGDPDNGTAGTGAATSADTGVYLGKAIAAAASGDDFVYVLHLPIRRQGVTTAIADPGNAGAIPVTSSGYVPLVTAGSETRTLAAPTFIGQQLLLYVKTDGGTCVITVGSAINQAGNTVITMADVRDVINLVAIESGSNKVWHVVSNDGSTLS